MKDHPHCVHISNRMKNVTQAAYSLMNGSQPWKTHCLQFEAKPDGVRGSVYSVLPYPVRDAATGLITNANESVMKEIQDSIGIAKLPKWLHLPSEKKLKDGMAMATQTFYNRNKHYFEGYLRPEYLFGIYKNYFPWATMNTSSLIHRNS